jgi:hypothetical protein
LSRETVGHENDRRADPFQLSQPQRQLAQRRRDDLRARRADRVRRLRHIPFLEHRPGRVVSLPPLERNDGGANGSDVRRRLDGGEGIERFEHDDLVARPEVRVDERQEHVADGGARSGVDVEFVEQQTEDAGRAHPAAELEAIDRLRCAVDGNLEIRGAQAGDRLAPRIGHDRRHPDQRARGAGRVSKPQGSRQRRRGEQPDAHTSSVAFLKPTANRDMRPCGRQRQFEWGSTRTYHR